MQNDVGHLKLHPGWCLDGYCGASIWVVEHWSICISQIERMCQQLKQGKAEELRGETKLILKNIQPPKPNISKEEARAIQELRRDKEKILLTANKGVSMVVMDKEEYIKKLEDLLKQNTYRELATDPTNKYKKKLINLLKTIKAEGGINNITYKRL